MNDFKLCIAPDFLSDANRKIFLAISGGLDSVVLLHMILESKLNVHLLHVNYHLRDEDSILDEKFVRELAKINSVPISVLDFNMKEHLKKNGGNLQAEARKIRYSFFQEFLKKEPNSILFTAHHFDDQMETFFMNLGRKSGSLGMSCMLAKNDSHWRPLLDFTKNQLLDFAEEKQLMWREDRSNSDVKYLRNRWRNEWLPLLRNKVPNLEKSVSILIQSFQNQREIVEKKQLPIYEQIEKEHIWHFSDFDNSSLEGKYLVAKKIGLRFSELEKLNQLRHQEKSKIVEIPRLKLIIWRESNCFYLEFKSNRIIPKLKREVIQELPESFSKSEYYADSEKIKGELHLRFWQQGDKIASVGLQGTQLISDIIKDAKIPPSKKQNVLVVEDEEKILWCVGLKIGKHGLASKESKQILRIWMEPSDFLS